MAALLLRIAALTAVYLLVLTSLRPADILTGLVLSMLVVAANRRLRSLLSSPSIPLLRRLTGVPALVGGTLVDIAKGAWLVAGVVVGRRPLYPGLVEVPIPPCGPASAAAWGIRVGLSPDTVVVEVDEVRGRMLLHVLDARDPEAVIAEQHDLYRRRQRRVLP